MPAAGRLTPYPATGFMLPGMVDSADRKYRPYAALSAAAAGAGSAFAAVLASSCCVPIVAPLIVAFLGVGGAAWAAGLKPYSPYLLAGSFVLLLYGLWTVHRPRPACSTEVRPKGAGRGIKAVLWASVAIWLVALLVNLCFSPS